MKEDKEYVIPLDEKAVEELGNKITQYIDFDGQWHRIYEQDEVIKQLQERIDKAIEHINKFDQIKAYFEYVDEDGYDEYNYDESFKNDILEILKGVE